MCFGCILAARFQKNAFPAHSLRMRRARRNWRKRLFSVAKKPQPLAESGFQMVGEDSATLPVSRKSRAGASFPLDAHRRAWGKNRTFSGTPHFWRLSEKVLQQDFAEVVRGTQLLLDRARQCALFAGGGLTRSPQAPFPPPWGTFGEA